MEVDWHGEGGGGRRHRWRIPFGLTGWRRPIKSLPPPAALASCQWVPRASSPWPFFTRPGWSRVHRQGACAKWHWLPASGCQGQDALGRSHDQDGRETHGLEAHATYGSMR
ncbi:hypothetical protein OP10G_1889 [Fimbriimonas ginsengisoli Gsoil 348]|uniref:Uncharacterized protein n=1 Tax=Fimbriimonas ginsengisoli Gsoil 348 TaxID=661478 RepID=A0A068NPF7_FIMGI|nr:hypothetical protein OP10G_1889 [Fimbriimonas ginsengisoli Gsoil 348]